MSMLSGYTVIGMEVTDEQFLSKTITSVTFTFKVASGSATGVDLTCYLYDSSFANPTLIQAKTGLTITTSETDVTFSNDPGVDVSSSGGYILLSYPLDTLKLVCANSTVSSPCSPTSTLANGARIVGGAGIIYTTDYPKTTVIYESTPTPSSTVFPPPPIAMIGGY